MSKWLIALGTAVTLFVLVAACAPAATLTPAPTTAPASKPAATTPPAASAASPTAKPAATTPPAASAVKPTPWPASKPLEKVKIMVPSLSAGRIEFHMGVDAGIFKEEGLDAEIVVLNASLAAAALMNGDIDYMTAPDPALAIIVKGEPARQVMDIKVNNSWHIFLAPGLSTAKELEGKAIGTNSRGGANVIAATAGLVKLGVDPSKVNFVVMPTYPEMLAALKSGAIAGASLSSPMLYIAQADGLNDVVDTRDVMKAPSSGLTTTLKKIQENPDQVKRVIRAVLRSNAYVKSHKAEAVQWLMKQFELAQPIADKVYTEELTFRSPDGTITEEGLVNYVGLLKAAGVDANVEAVRKATDQTLLKEAQKELGLIR